MLVNQVLEGQKKEVQIDIDSNRIAFLEISLLEIVRKIKENNVDISSGSIEEGKENILVEPRVK